MVSASRVVPTTKIGVDDVDGSSDLAVEMGVFQSTVSPRFTTMFILISSIGVFCCYFFILFITVLAEVLHHAEGVVPVNSSCWTGVGVEITFLFGG